VLVRGYLAGVACAVPPGAAASLHPSRCPANPSGTGTRLRGRHFAAKRITPRLERLSAAGVRKAGLNSIDFSHRGSTVGQFFSLGGVTCITAGCQRRWGSFVRPP